MTIKNEMEHNAVLGLGRINKETRVVEGKVDAENAKKEAFGQLSAENLSSLDYDSYKDSMENIRRNGDKMLAKTHFSKDLKDNVAEKLNIDIGLIKIYKATGTVLDKYHKVSAWVEVLGGEERVFVTMDIFTSEKNKRNRADIIFKKPEKGFNQLDGNDEYLAILEDVANSVVEKMKIKGYTAFQRKYKKGRNPVDWSNSKGKRVVKFAKKE